MRGAVRLDFMTWDPEALRAELPRFGDEWQPLGYGTAWHEIPLIKPTAGGGTKRHPGLDGARAFDAILQAFPSPPLDATLARLGPGGAVKTHRDISGGVPMGVARFHVPIVTDPEVEFVVNSKRLYMAPGETWNLDTTYPHSLNNRSSVWRIHFILDVKLNEAVAAMLPPTDFRALAHRARFSTIVVGKGLSTAVRSPKQALQQARHFVGLRVFGRSSLYDAE